MEKALSLPACYRQAGQPRTQALTLPVATAALLLVDVYYADQAYGTWGDPADPLTSRFERMAQQIGVALAAARAADMPVLFAMNSAPRIALERSAFGAHFARSWSDDGAPDAFTRAFAEGGVDPREYCGGPETPLKIAPALAPRPSEPYIRKHVYSAFFDSRLDTALRNLGVHTLFCAGLWANVCMAATALDALYRNYTVIWLRDGTLAGETKTSIAGLENTARWIEWFEEVVGYTVAADEFAAACAQGGAS
ncbi:MAG: cysteine hydrolase family protein [Anaerolineae bacterium]